MRDTKKVAAGKNARQTSSRPKLAPNPGPGTKRLPLDHSIPQGQLSIVLTRTTSQKNLIITNAKYDKPLY